MDSLLHYTNLQSLKEIEQILGMYERNLCILHSDIHDNMVNQYGINTNFVQERSFSQDRK